LEGVTRVRQIEVSPEIATGILFAPGDRLEFNLFDGQPLVGIVDYSDRNCNDTTTVVGKIEGELFSYFAIASTDGKVSAEFTMPASGREHSVYARGDAYYAFDYDPAKRGRLEGGHPEPLPARPEGDGVVPAGMALVGGDGVSAPAAPGSPTSNSVIDVMLIYTPLAKTYADTNLTSIANAVALTIAKGQTCLTNSNINITWTLVHSAQVTYTESGSSGGSQGNDSGTDLNRLTFHSGYDPWGYEGSPYYIDEIHTWRSTYGADIVGMLTYVSDTGGLGWLLNTTAGWKEIAFHITRVQQATWTATDIHESGHNMGTHHSKTQTVQAGPGLYTYAAGWQWSHSPPPTGYTTGYCTLMTYENFDNNSGNGNEYKRIDYFSDPLLSPAAGGSHPCGDATNGDNASCLRNIKDTVAAYFTVASAAEIDVQGNGQSIADGDTSPSLADHTDFGSTAVVGGTVVRTFTIANTGSATLNLTGTPLVAVSGAHAGDFSVTAQPASSSVAAAGSTTFQVTFDPSATGLRSATISIANNDADENPYDFSIQGTGGSPEIDVQGNGQSIVNNDVTPSLTDHTDFGSAAVSGGTVTRVFTVANTGLATLNLTGVPPVSLLGPDAGDFTVAVQPSASVAASGSTTFQVTFDPSVAGVRNAIVTIANDDSDENPYTFAIQGTGTEPEIDVQGNGQSIVNNDMAPDAADGTDFGQAVIGGAAVSTTFTAVNAGTATLNLSGTPRVALGGPDAADFAVTLQPSATVSAGGGTTTFTIAFTPGIPGPRNATVSIANDDADENPYLFAIRGEGTLPTHEVVFIALPGGTVDGAERVTQTVTEGSDCAPVTAIPDPSYEFVAWSGDAVGADATITITNVTADMTVHANFAAAEKVACGLLFEVPADEIADAFPALAEFSKSPKAWGQYHDRFKDPFAVGKPKKAVAKVAKIAKGTTAASVEAEWRKKLRLYDAKAFKAGQKGGTGIVAWLEDNPVRDLAVTLFASGKEPAVGAYLDELRPVALAGPTLDAVRDVTDTVDIADASELPPGGQILIKGRWFGIKPPKAWLEYRDAADAIKCLKLKAVKPHAFDAYGKEDNSVMDPTDGTSALVLQLPEVLPPDIAAIVIDNGVGLVARDLEIP